MIGGSWFGGRELCTEAPPADRRFIEYNIYLTILASFFALQAKNNRKLHTQLLTPCPVPVNKTLTFKIVVVVSGPETLSLSSLQKWVFPQKRTAEERAASARPAEAEDDTHLVTSEWQRHKDRAVCRISADVK